MVPGVVSSLNGAISIGTLLLLSSLCLIYQLITRYLRQTICWRALEETRTASNHSEINHVKRQGLVNQSKHLADLLGRFYDSWKLAEKSCFNRLPKRGGCGSELEG